MNSITILGAGVAGLAAARALALEGWRVTVFERAPVLADVGAGLQIGPNGARVLRALGLNAGDMSLRGQAVELRDQRGARVLRMDLGGRYWHLFHRADLIDLLARGAVEAGAELRLGEVGEPDGLTIGADGLHSHSRVTLNGAVPAAFTGHVAWRAVIPDTNSDAVSEVHMGPGRHLVSYPLRGGAFRNIVAVEERTEWAEESWTARDDSDDLQRAFAGFGPRVRGWLEKVERPWLWGLFLHPVAERWHGDGLILAGDAAHPTLPFMAQGANMALEDAWILSRCLIAGDRGERYQALRQERCRRIVQTAAGNARIYHLSGAAAMLAHAGMRIGGRLAPEAPMRRFDWIYGYDAVQASSSIQTGT
ncbi:FAD-dependent oxidoreductase [Falsirhodobacter sp. 20TX0035]|uniref:FAD-dependent oxidoreductase n=1 Tax=Falsirhodobacter sp. 20TX0035 TaxID=3022019 RepID=UPI00232C55BF|nr:FAD-dependent oxidoreductase [Falsirhodobacter sp. 20TX0035]MDB6455195.1 FAD-dependent monooxygenase [Falsirhodobacter sp. 20TX0035]